MSINYNKIVDILEKIEYYNYIKLILRTIEKKMVIFSIRGGFMLEIERLNDEIILDKFRSILEKIPNEQYDKTLIRLDSFLDGIIFIYNNQDKNIL